MQRGQNGHIRVLITAFMLSLTASAQAATIGLSPLFPSGVDSKAIQGVHQLIEAELEFAPDIERTVALAVRPPVLGPNCVKSTACLAGVSKATDTDLFVGGVLRANGPNYTLELTLYDVRANTIVRSNQWQVPRAATELSNAITPILVELLTGQDPNAEEAAGPSVADFEDAPLDDDEALDFDTDPLLPPAEPAPVAVQPAEADPFASIQFGGAADDIQSEDLSMVQFGPKPSTGDTAAPPNTPAAVEGGVVGGVLDGASQPMVSANGVTDLDSPEPDAKRPRRRKTPATTPTSDHTVQVTARGGYAVYYSLDFASAGLEIALPVADRLDVMVGVDTYMTRRRLTPDLQAATGVLATWESILPWNAGALYRVPAGGIEFYGGADVIVAPYYIDEIGADWTVGGRARFGANIPISKNLGLNIDSSLGLWSGRTWRLIEQGIGNTGLLPRVAAGLVVRL